ncbi:muts domain V-domain-containing protein [Podospora aff. communis PSN243]|uniref:Muts domain V-domain-containing protein n=1 Tax=Podospora aff. communis PSN243 TaxID=3040156 RepID=A0AAV9GN33_9PEZI|nr:muts domain V-domain-containing protein [Podospora aff. communis PSN243]
MGIDVNKDGNVGCAYYIAIDETLHIEEDIALGGLEAVETLLLRIQPTTVIVPNRAPGALVELLEKDSQRLDDEASNPERGSYILRHIVSAAFDFENGRDTLANLDLEPPTPDHVEVTPAEDDMIMSLYSSDHMKLVRLAQMINLDSHLSIGCAGAVLGDIERRRIAEVSYLGSEERGPFQVLSVKMSTPEDTMLVSADTLVSLQIVQSELHPNPQLQYSGNMGSKSKESLSVYGLLQALACTAQGKLRLRQMLFRPTTDIDIIEKRQQAISVFLLQENQETVATIRKLLRKVKNTKSLLRYVKLGVDRIRGQLSVRTGEWRALVRFVMASVQIREAILLLSGYSKVDVLERVINSIDPREFLSIGESVLKTIDFKLSKENGKTELRPGASKVLDELRQAFSRVCRMLPAVEDAVRSEVPLWAARHIHYCTIMLQMGFLVAITLNEETGEGVYSGDDTMDENWQIFFVHENLAFYKSNRMLDLDHHYGDLPVQISDEEINVMLNLAAEIMVHETCLMAVSELFGELDSILALAAAAEKYRWAAPRMTSSNIVAIADGRHPLQELLVPSFIPNDCFLEGGAGLDDSDAGNCVDEMDDDDPEEDENVTVTHEARQREELTEDAFTEDSCTVRGDSVVSEDRMEGPSMLILTGPNNSGKSVYMKQIAVIVYLAHIGSYVPATSAVIGITDCILTRIATRETVIVDESAFLVDIKQAAFTLNFATRRSLILADEFGKGTSTEDGSALFTAYLVHLLDMGPERPRVIVGTHFHDIFENGLLEEREGVGFAHMDVKLNEEAEEMEDEITYLHKLLPGRGESSLASSCAAQNGVDPEIIERADDLIAYQETNEDLEVVCVGLTEKEQQHVGVTRLRTQRFLELEIPGQNASAKELDPLRNMLGGVIYQEKDGMDEIDGGGFDLDP